MDEEDAEQLVATLCTAAGMLMEDALPTALFRPASAEEITGNLDRSARWRPTWPL